MAKSMYLIDRGTLEDLLDAAELWIAMVESRRPDEEDEADMTEFLSDQAHYEQVAAQAGLSVKAARFAVKCQES